MNDATSIALILAATRSLLLIICELAAILCIYLGWKLYIKAVASTTEGEFSGLGFKLKLASGGPGVFLCGLGIWLLLSVANRPFETTTSESISSTQLPGAVRHLGAATKPSIAEKLPVDFYFATSVQAQPTPVTQPKPAEKSSVCLVRTVTSKMDVGLSLTTVEIEQAAKTAAAAIRRAGPSSIRDDEERARTVRVLDKLAIDAAKSYEAERP